MFKKLIAMDDFNKIIIQCACVGHYSYLEILSINNQFILNITNGNEKKLVKLQEKLCFNNELMLKFINIVKSIEYTASNTFALESGLRIRFEYLQLDRQKSKLDMINIKFFENNKKFMNDKSSFNIVLSRTMWKDLIKNLDIIYCKEVLDEKN